MSTNRLGSQALALAALCTAGLGTLGMQGCLVSGSSRESISGRYISPTTFDQIEPGVTTCDGVVGLLGEPQGRAPAKDGGEIWRWHYTRCRSSSGAVLLVFAGSDSKSDQVTTYAHVRDGVVVRTWQDKAS